MKYSQSTIRLCVGLAATLLALVGPAAGQTADEHASHHPAPGGANPAPTGPAAPAGMPMPGGGNQAAPVDTAGTAGSPPAAAPAGGMAAGMGEMMKQMGTPARKELYPSLMALPDDVTHQERTAIEELAQQRMKEGTARLSSGLAKLSDSTANEDYAAMQQAAEQMREGLAEFEAAIAARRILSEGTAPRNLALDWFKREMNLASPIGREGSRTLFGVAPFHLFTMVLLVAFGLAMLAMYFFKMRRAEALFGRIDPDKKPPPPPGAPPPSSEPKPPAPKAPESDEPGPAAPLKPAPGEPAAAPPAAGSPPAPGGDNAKSGGRPASPPAPEGAAPAPPGADPAKVADRAGELWKARGSPIGSPKEDWLQAEQEFAKAAENAPVQSGTARAEATATPPVTANWKGQLRIGSIVTATPSLKTFHLLPSTKDRVLPFTFLPGQFLNVAFWIGGAKMNRSYSIASSPTQREYIELAIRREPRGAVSRHIDDLLKVGDLIDAGGPVGKFTFTGTEADSIVLISAGVGITPMMSITRYLSERKWSGDIFFVYTCSKPADFIFAAESAALQRSNPKLHVAVTISKPEGTDWKGPRGRITKDWLLQTVPDLASRRTHLCGPPLMMESIKAIFAELGIPPEQLKTEAFGLTKPAPAAPETSAKPTSAATGPLVTFSKNGKSAKIRLDLKSGDSPPKQTILELSEELGIGIEFSCRVGTCGVCKVKKTSGEVDMEVQDALDDDDKAQNIILACQAKPKSEVTVEA